MKVFVSFVVLAVIACGVNGFPQDAQSLAKVQEHVEICRKENGVEEEVALKLAAGDFTLRDEKSQCFTSCFFKRTGFMNAEGVPQKDVIIAKLASKTGVHNEQLEELIGTCVLEKGANECETAYKIFECYWKGRALVKSGEVAKN